MVHTRLLATLVGIIKSVRPSKDWYVPQVYKLIKIHLETISRINENGDMTIYKGEVDVFGKKCGKGIMKHPQKNDQANQGDEENKEFQMNQLIGRHGENRKSQANQFMEGTWFDDKPHGLMREEHQDSNIFLKEYRDGKLFGKVVWYHP